VKQTWFHGFLVEKVAYLAPNLHVGWLGRKIFGPVAPLLVFLLLVRYLYFRLKKNVRFNA
jgi:hypothetical protein